LTVLAVPSLLALLLAFRINKDYRATALIGNRLPLGPYSRTIHRAIWWS